MVNEAFGLRGVDNDAAKVWGQGAMIQSLGPMNNPYTGGVKYDDNKRRWDLFPWSSAEEIVKVLEFGAKKYGDHNWRKGMSWSRLFAATCRHLFAWWWGKEDVDPESGLSHLAHAGCCILFALDYVLTKKGTDNR